jgi:hypothetical protein
VGFFFHQITRPRPISSPTETEKLVDIALPGTISIARACGDVPCGQCEPCHRKVMLNLASYALRSSETQEEDDPKGVLLDLLDKLGLPS